jgi:hypothetical protein
MREARIHKTGATGRRTGFVWAGALSLALVALLAGCSSLKKSIDRINHEASSSGGLESFIQDELTTKFHRSVRSVSCTPYTDQVLPGDTAHLSCLVRFTSGTSYTAAATITDPSTDPDVALNHFSFQDPPGVDITTAPLPSPAVILAATSPASLFAARNLTPVIQRLTARFGGHDLIIQLALYPGELEAVIAGKGGTAWAVSFTDSGGLTVGPPVSFSGSRNGIAFSQFVPGVIQRLAKLIVARGKVTLGHLNRFVLTSLPHGNAGWNIYLTSGITRFQAYVLGDHLVMIAPGGARALH